ncbi:MAG: alpha/beta hydrolase fold domain-containing protein [Aeromicrobium sp.]
MPGCSNSDVPSLSPRSTLATVRHVLTGRPLRVARSVRYGPSAGQELDIWRSPGVDVTSGSAPVLLFVPGGGWVHGRAAGQGGALMGRLASRGWVCVAVNYRVSPNHAWPTHIEDVKRALGWVHRNIGAFGGSADFVAIAGASAGGHLATLAGLTSEGGRWQPGFDQEPVSVDAVVSLYGRYDWESRGTRERQRFMDFLERVVVRATQAEAGDVFADASPMAQIRLNAPPMLVVHGACDAIIPVDQARQFVSRMAAVSAAPTVYAELPGAGHAFDIVDPYRAVVMSRAIEHFLDHVRAMKVEQRSRPSAS